MQSLAETSSPLVLTSVSKTLQVISVCFNGAIVYTIWRKSLMRIPSSRFVFSLSLSHLLVSLMSLVISTVSALSQINEGVSELSTRTLGHSGDVCYENLPVVLDLILLYCTFAVAISTLITVTLISIERYITIARPMKYKSIVTPKRCFTAISLSWIVAAFFVIIPPSLFDTKTITCANTLVPVGLLRWYFAAVFTLLTIVALAVMITCYSHIFSIAKEKCQKVQIGQFSVNSSPPSISSDWPSSVHSSVQGQPINRGWFSNGGSSRMTSSNSLLHWVLMANLRQHSNTIRTTHTMGKSKWTASSPTSSTRSEPGQVIGSSTGGPTKDKQRLTRAKLRWKRYLQQNYNSPRKTVCTILLLIGSVILTQAPISFLLFFKLDHTPMLFYICHDILFALSSVLNPILYGFLNRNIRDQLWKVFRPQKRRRNRQKRANSMSNGIGNNSGVNGELRDILTPKTDKLLVSVNSSRNSSLTSEDSNSGISTVKSQLTPCSSNASSGSGSSSGYNLRRDTFVGFDELNRFKLKMKLSKLGSYNVNQAGDVPGRNGDVRPVRKMTLGQMGKGEERRNEIDIVRHEMLPIEEGNGDGIIMEDEILQGLEFPRKPSQDSGADMSFSDEEPEDQEEAAIVHKDVNNPTAIAAATTSHTAEVERYLRIYGNFSDMKPKSKSDSDIIHTPTSRNTYRGSLSRHDLLQQVEHLPLEQVVNHGLEAQQQKLRMIKSQCQIGPEMQILFVSSHHQHRMDVEVEVVDEGAPSSSLPFVLSSLSSSRRNSLHELRVQANSSSNKDNNSYDNPDANAHCISCCSKDNLIECCIICSCSNRSSSSRLERRGSRDYSDDYLLTWADLSKIGNVFHDDKIIDNPDDDSGSSSCSESGSSSSENDEDDEILSTISQNHHVDI